MEENSVVAEMITRSSVLRGKILNDMVYMERLMDEYLSRHFCKQSMDVRTEIMELLFCTERITLNSKKDIFNALVKKHEPGFIKKNPNYTNEINDLLTKRNILAHQLLDTSDYGKEKFKDQVIVFVKINPKKEKFEFTDSIFIDLQEKVKKYITGLTELLTIYE